MSEADTILLDTAGGIFSELAETTDFASGWAKIKEAGFPALLIREDKGGFGGTWQDAFSVLRLAGLHRLPLPVGEAIVVNYCLDVAGMDDQPDLVLLADGADGVLQDGFFSGTLRHVPWGRNAEAILAIVGDHAVLLPTDHATIEHLTNIAGEPRDTLHFLNTPVMVLDPTPNLRALGAFVRVAQSAGALDAQLAMTIEYVNTRQQFGKPLSKLQAVQQNLAVAAMEAAAVNTAGQALAVALARGEASLEVAAAKLRTNTAIGSAVGIMHQVHGAIGFTQEYPLNHLTRRLLSWRSEYGGDTYWANVLGGMVARLGANNLWDELTKRSDDMRDGPVA